MLIQGKRDARNLIFFPQTYLESQPKNNFREMVHEGFKLTSNILEEEIEQKIQETNQQIAEQAEQLKKLDQELLELAKLKVKINSTCPVKTFGTLQHKLTGIIVACYNVPLCKDHFYNLEVFDLLNAENFWSTLSQAYLFLENKDQQKLLQLSIKLIEQTVEKSKIVEKIKEFSNQILYYAKTTKNLDADFIKQLININQPEITYYALALLATDYTLPEFNQLQRDCCLAALKLSDTTLFTKEDKNRLLNVFTTANLQNTVLFKKICAALSRTPCVREVVASVN